MKEFTLTVTRDQLRRAAESHFLKGRHGECWRIDEVDVDHYEEVFNEILAVVAADAARAKTDNVEMPMEELLNGRR